MTGRSKASGPTPKQYRCAACGRSFVGFGDASAGTIQCVCGAELLPRSLPRGIYELRSTEPHGRRAARQERSHGHGHAGVLKEADLGYGESHGYGPAHGGPTGPGDAPANGEEVASPAGPP